MTKETQKLTEITADDIAFVEKELAASSQPRSVSDLAQKLAFDKTAGQRTQAVKKYDPECIYQVGDQIYKEYDETLSVGSKAVEHFQGAVVLEVVSKTYFPSFQSEMIEVDYPGGGIFRKYLEYMKKTRTQVLLPSNTGGAARTPENLDSGDDPRLTELPMTDRDLHSLERKLRTSLNKAPGTFTWNDRWHLKDRQIDIPDAVVDSVREDIAENGVSVSTEDIVRKFFRIEPSNDLFDLHCMSLGFTLEKKHKKDILLVSPEGWGRWHLKKALKDMAEGRAIAAAEAPLPEFESSDKTGTTASQDFPVKIYLTWREILSGGIKPPKSLARELAKSREYLFTDPEENKTYTLYYYPDENFFLGLLPFFEAHHIPQGASLTIERRGPNAFHFWVKKSKKKLAVPKVTYNTESGHFEDAGEDMFTFALPNKIIFIERETLHCLLPLTETEADNDLGRLILRIYDDPHLSTETRALHFLRVYHLADIIRSTTQEDVETVLLNLPEFEPSEKKKGVFIFRRPIEPGEEIPAFEDIPADVEEPVVAKEEEPAEAAAPETSVYEDLIEDILEEGEVAAPDEAPRRPPEPPAEKKDKPKRKKPKIEGERARPTRKSERRVITEKIADEESEIEAFTAIKQADEDGQELRPREKADKKADKKEDFKPLPKEDAGFGFFAEKLKSALKQTKKDEGDKPEPAADKDEPAAPQDQKD